MTVEIRKKGRTLSLKGRERSPIQNIVPVRIDTSLHMTVDPVQIWDRNMGARTVVIVVVVVILVLIVLVVVVGVVGVVGVVVVVDVVDVVVVVVVVYHVKHGKVIFTM